MSVARAYAKINLALVVGPPRGDAKHEVATVLQRIDLHDDVALESAASLEIRGFAEDTLVRAALEGIGDAAHVPPHWRVRIVKRIPVAAGLGGGSSDAATALVLANATLVEPLPPICLHPIAAGIGADVPFFLREHPQLATGDGTMLREVALPSGYVVLLVLPVAAVKDSTRTVYERFDEHDGAQGFGERRAALERALAEVGSARDLSHLPRNDLAASPLSQRLEELGAFRADVSGAGPIVYGLFEDGVLATRAREELRSLGKTWLARPL